MKNCVCQSCGMPLYKPEMYGTGADGMPVEDYCEHCYKDGGFTSDVTMDEMMRLCANYVDGNASFYIANMRMLYPHLKRWAKKENTESEYYKSVNRVMEYVKGHIHENTDLKTLAGIAHISPYHFHRIFKSVIGESLAEYVNRLRMEYVAEQLKTSGLSLAELALRTGYSSEQALSRAFKKYSDLPPKTFRAIYFRETFGGELTPRICKVASKNIVMLREQTADGRGWQKLYMYAMVNRLLSESTESLEVIRGGDYLPALTTAELKPGDRHADGEMLPEGLYAIFTHRGETAAVVYLNNPAMVPPGELLTEIYVPLAEKQAV